MIASIGFGTIVRTFNPLCPFVKLFPNQLQNGGLIFGIQWVLLQKLENLHMQIVQIMHLENVLISADRHVYLQLHLPSSLDLAYFFVTQRWVTVIRWFLSL